MDESAVTVIGPSMLFWSPLLTRASPPVEFSVRALGTEMLFLRYPVRRA